MSTDTSLITWEKDFLIGDKDIDEEHKGLFIIARKADAIKEFSNEEKQKEFLKQIVEELDYYVNLHFKNEEKFMRSINYPFLHAHIKKHKKMLEILSFIALNLDLISASESNYNLHDFIQNVFVNHIISEDIKIVQYKKETSS